MSKGSRLSSGQGVTRRGFTAGALGTGLILGTGRAPAIAQGKRDLRVGVWGGEFGNLSPVIRYDIQGGLVLYNLFDGLVEIDFDKRSIEPLLALEWANPDPLTWRIKLREGVKWQKGFGEFTAEDVVYTWNFHLESKSFQVGTALFPLDTVKADGKYVVEVKTKQPFGAFPGVTMGYGGTIISAKAHKEMGNQAYCATPVGNGAFQIESKRGTEITLVKNPDYWRPGFPKLDKVVYRAIPDSTTRLQALVKNELDFVTHPDPKEVGAMRKNANFVVKSTPGWEWDYQQFNLKGRPDAPYQNKLVRQAISYAIDREAIVNEIYYGEATGHRQPDPGRLHGLSRPDAEISQERRPQEGQGADGPGRRQGLRGRGHHLRQGLAAQGARAGRRDGEPDRHHLQDQEYGHGRLQQPLAQPALRPGARGHHPGGARSRRHLVVVPAQQGQWRPATTIRRWTPCSTARAASSTRASARRCTTRSSTPRSRSARSSITATPTTSRCSTRT